MILFLIWWNCLPDKLFDDPTSTVLTDKDGTILGARIADDGQWRFPERSTVPYKFKQAIIQFEDRRFYDHMGFSFRAFVRAMGQNIKAREVVSGGSTISMQLIRISRKGKSRNVWEKGIEVFQATRLEQRLSKDEILAKYASHAPMGGNVVGLDAAAWRYFGKKADNLSWAESCMLAILPNAPSLIHPGKNRQQLIDKRNRLLQRLYEVGEIDDYDLRLALAEPIPDKPPNLPDIAPHLMDKIVLSHQKGQWVHSSIDIHLQTNVKNIVGKHHKNLSENQIHNAAVLVLDNKTGKVLAYIGNTDDDNPEHGNAVDVIHAPRSTGSILKPFLYASMLHDGLIMPDQLVEDVPMLISGYSPKNYNNKYDGAVRASTALARSLNVPIVKLLKENGVQKFHHTLNKLGMSTINQPSSYYGLALILGGAEATLWDLCSIYGNMSRQLGGEKEKKAIAYSYNQDEEILENANLQFNRAAVWSTFEAMIRVARPEGESSWEQFSSSQKIAWKTGTSFGFRDAWAVGVTPKYTVGVWVGNADGEGRPGLVGIQAAAPVLFDVFDKLDQATWYKKPYEDMTKIAVCAESGFRASQFTSQIDTVWAPKSCLKTTACPYSKRVHFDNTGSYRVNASCMDADEMISKDCFVLPPLIEKYYRNKHPDYQVLPPYKDLCNEDGEDGIAIIYPKYNSRIYLPINLDGTQSNTVFEASHRSDTLKLYWHLDDIYLGETQDFHQINVSPPLGKHTLTIVDELGGTVSRDFEVLMAQ